MPLTVAVTPDFDKSFKQVAGRAPFTVAFDANIGGGAPPYRVAWDFDGDGKTDSAAPEPDAFVFAQPGEYSAVVTVRDANGATARATRRIVAFAAPQLPAWRYGVTAHLERRRAGFYPTLNDVARSAQWMQVAGLQAARMDFNWDLLNPVEGQWQFQDYDAVVGILRAHNIELLGIVDYVSWWASSAQTSNDWRVRLYSAPRTDYDFARYTYALVTHYKNDVRVWQLWNEPNTVNFWKPKPAAARYVQLLQEAYLAAKYADPHAVVVFGGLSGNGVDGDDSSGLASNFLADAYAAGAAGYFDVMAIHPYLLPNSGIQTLRAKIDAARAVMQRTGGEKIPLWLTEIGAPSAVPWWQTAPLQSEQAVAAWLEQVYTQLWDLTPTIFWYDLQDQGSGSEPEQHFGLLRPDFSPKPAYDRLRTLIAR